jgi:predicted nuclease of predicted toxin-antitoxin system
MFDVRKSQTESSDLGGVTLWIDVQISPAIADWIVNTLGVTAIAVRTLGLRNASDEEIFAAARVARACVLTKDADFLRLLEAFGPPPQILWLTCGNTVSARLREVLSVTLHHAMSLLNNGDSLVELSDRG